MKLNKTLLILTMLSGMAHAMLPNPSVTALDSHTYALPHTSTQQGIQTSLHAFVLEGDTLSPVAPDTNLSTDNIIEYHAYIANHTKERIRSVNVSFDIPMGAELIEGFSPIATLLASVDGNRFHPAPLRTNINGQVQDIPPSQYKAIRWNVQDIGIDGVAVVKFRVKLK